MAWGEARGRRREAAARSHGVGRSRQGDGINGLGPDAIESTGQLLDPAGQAIVGNQGEDGASNPGG